ncbi:molybdopterin-dependent oxidoreductase [Dermatophilus congolensis]|uniref:molybdopterin-dependent oxidoreductase n=1 Tax=Dermatophilus congolensis TaxID=1863 RepID=UPI001FBB4290|nr:molybdopterin-dependent oxidoreductase [Dermatophilus congolensis]
MGHGDVTGTGRGEECNGPQRASARHYGPVPRLDINRWRLAITGATCEGMYCYTWDDILDMPMIDVPGTIHCAQQGRGITQIWRGVPTSHLLSIAPPDPKATHALAAAAYGFSSTLRLRDLNHPETILATYVDGVPLTPQHGAPLRLFAPHLFGWKSVKWLLEISYLMAPEPGFWECRGYHMVGKVSDGHIYAHQE